MTKRFSFTLAEVLITLGIIGVVAAMTMPTLMNSTQGAQYKAAYKKALSALSQAVTLNVALDGSSFADVVAGTAGKTDKPADGDSVASILGSRMNVVNQASTATAAGYTSFPGTLGQAKSCKEADKKIGDEGCTEQSTDISPDTFLFFNDGIMFAFGHDAAACTNDGSTATVNHCAGVIDVNGIKGPNKVVSCDKNTGTGSTACKVSNPTDIYPVVFYDQTILPASDAAKVVLYSK